MITFTVPTPYFASSTVVTVDRNPSIDATIRKLEQRSQDFLLEQSRVDGINYIEETFTFTIANRPRAYIKVIDTYFSDLKGTKTILFSFPGSITKKVVINSWNTILLNSLYGKIEAQAEVVFL
ncbi:hypothetical protein EBZ38_01795 [bacterium]|nr:hypothetical protein [bacterium]